MAENLHDMKIYEEIEGVKLSICKYSPLSLFWYRSYWFIIYDEWKNEPPKNIQIERKGTPYEKKTLFVTYYSHSHSRIYFHSLFQIFTERRPSSLTLYLILNGRIQSLTRRNGNSILKSSWSLFISGSNCPFSV